MDVEKALLDQNLVLGEIKGGVNEIKELQRIANGRTSKLEAKVEMLPVQIDEKVKAVEKEFSTKIEVVDRERNELKGSFKTLKVIGSILLGLSTVASLAISYFK